jgi:hypothetical protein
LPFALFLCLTIFILSPIASLAQAIPVPVPRSEGSNSSAAVSPVPDDPARIYQTACPALLSGRIRGRLIEPLNERGCGTLSPIAVEAIGANGEIELTGKPILNCSMATGLAQFAEQADTLARQRYDTGLAGIGTGPGYDCRRRNRATEGKLSEHAFANAVDIVNFELTDGRMISVESDWPMIEETESDASPQHEESPPLERADDDAARFLAELHATACKLFTTVLGPDANAAHRSHFHFDLGCHGRDCTYLICE